MEFQKKKKRKKFTNARNLHQRGKENEYTAVYYFRLSYRKKKLKKVHR